MNKYALKTIFTMLAVLFFALSAQAQTGTQVETMTIFGTFTPTIKLTPKIEHNPEPDNYAVKPPVIAFEMQTEAIHSVETTELLTSDPLPKDQVAKYLHNYLILGFGNYITPYGEFYANTSQMQNHAFGIRLKHVSSQGGIKNYADNSFSHNLGDIYYKFSGRAMTVKADVFLKRDVVHYYGFNPNEFFNPPSDSIKQRYFLGGATVSFSSNDINPTDFGYSARLKYYNLSDRFENRENAATFNADFRKGFFLFNTRNPQKAGAALNLAYFNNNIFVPTNRAIFIPEPNRQTGAVVQNDIQVGVRPYFECDWSEYRLRVGVNIGIFRNGNEDPEPYLHPIVEANVKVIQNRLYLFARLGGSIERNSFLSLTDGNPFIAPGSYDVNFSNKRVTAAGGFSAIITKGLDLKIGGEYASIENMPFYMSLPDAPTRNFTTIFDDATQVDLFLESAYTLSNKIHIGASVHYYITQPDTLKHAYYCPDFKMILSGKYRLLERLLLGADFYFYSEMWAANPYQMWTPHDIPRVKDEKLPACFDLNLNAEYRVWNELYLFLQANNIFVQKNYQRYLNYPTQGLNVLGGIRFRF